MKKTKVYLANALFTECDRAYNDQIVNKLLQIPNIEVYAAQNNMEINDKGKPANSISIYKGDVNELATSDIVLVILDNNHVGVAAELGWITGYNHCHPNKPKKLIGVFSDVREISTNFSNKINQDILKSGFAENQYAYVDLYLIGACKLYGDVVSSVDKAIEWIKKEINKK